MSDRVVFLLRQALQAGALRDGILNQAAQWMVRDWRG